jgi:hypothetical protein
VRPVDADIVNLVLAVTQLHNTGGDGRSVDHPEHENAVALCTSALRHSP